MIHTKPNLFEMTPADDDRMRAIARRQLRAKIEHLAKPVAPQQITVAEIEDAMIESITGNAKRMKYCDHALHWKQIKQTNPQLRVLDEMNCPKTAMWIEGSAA